VNATASPSPAPAARQDYFSVQLCNLILDTVLAFDLFLPPENDASPVLYRHRDLQFSEEDRARLIDHQVEQLLISMDQEHLYQAYMEDNVARALTDVHLTLSEKTSILYTTACEMVRGFLSDPMTSELVPRTRKMVRTTMGHLQTDPEAFSSYLSTTSPTYTTQSHSTNVALYTLQLAITTGITDDQLLEDIGVGAFLHDIGKCRIPARILNKPGKLDAHEWRTMRKHTVWGCQILSLHGLWSPIAMTITRDHHEKLDGSGYPFGKKAEELPEYVRMATICDVFDAISTTRSYKEGIPSFNALETMKNEMTAQLDRRLFAQFIQMLLR